MLRLLPGRQKCRNLRLFPVPEHLSSQPILPILSRDCARTVPRGDVALVDMAPVAAYRRPAR